MPRITERIIELLETVNATAVNNDDGKPGEFLAELCKEGGRSPPRADYPSDRLVEGVLGGAQLKVTGRRNVVVFRTKAIAG